MSAAGFVDGAYMFKVWQSLNRQDKLDYVKLRNLLETKHLDLSRKSR